MSGPDWVVRDSRPGRDPVSRPTRIRVSRDIVLLCSMNRLGPPLTGVFSHWVMAGDESRLIVALMCYYHTA